MTVAEAQMLVAQVAAAFPREWSYAGEATNEIYVERLRRLPRFEAARDAVESLIDTEARLPTISKIREEYLRYVDRYLPRGLPEPEISPEERRLNRERLAALAAAIGTGISADDRRTGQNEAE